MFSKRMMLSLTFAMAFFSAQTAHAEAYFLRCDSCSAHQKGNLVSDSIQAENLPLHHDYYVYGLEPFSAQRFGVEKDMGFILAYPLNNSPELEPLISALDGLAETNNGSLTFTVHVTDPAFSGLRDAGSNSASGALWSAEHVVTTSYAGVYDYLNSPAIRRLASNSAMSSFSGAQATFFNIVRNFSTPVLNFDKDIHVRLVFEDGEVLARFNYSSEEFEYVSGTARDSNGNLIPDSPSEFANGGVRNYYFTGPEGPNNLNNFLNHAQMMGIPIVGGSSTGGGTPVIACVEAAGQIVCEVFVF